MRDLKWILFLFILCMIALAFLIQYANADTTEPAEPEFVMPAPLGNVSESRTIGQMDTVYWGETINMELVMGWEMKLVHAETGRVVDVSERPDRVYIHPEVFLVGEWDQWYPINERSGNTIAFYVEKKNTTVQPEPTVEEPSGFKPISNVTPEPPENYQLEEKHISDILVAKGDPLVYNISEKDALDPTLDSKIWIFGDRDMLLDIPVKGGTFSLSPTQTESLGAGTYHLVIEQAGPNTIPEARAVQKTEETTFHIESPFRNVPNLEIGGTNTNPEIISSKLYPLFKDWLAANTDDDVVIKEFVVQSPSIEITVIDEKYIDNDSVWLIRGYTNLAKGTPISAILDEGKQTARTIRKNTYEGFVSGDDPGSMREFLVSIPINYEEVPVEEHFVTVRSSQDVYSIVPRWVYNIPEGQEKPVLQTKYSGGNLFVPTPTPEIVKVPEPYEVVRTVVVTITPVPTPTPVPIPWFFQPPWYYGVILIIIVVTVLAGLWIMWKLGMI